MDPSEWEQVGSVQDPDNNGVMVSNLPLLFANGEPSSLQNMTQRQLERFVGFMVHCSVGEDLTKPWNKLPRPSWWPNKLPFKQPTGTTPTPSHRSMLQRLVERCYTYHGCEFLLQFCKSLVQQRPPNGYRFSDNRDGTTSMHHSETGKLLVTFRNENRDYDQLSGASSPTKFGSSSNNAQGRGSSRPQLLPRRASASAAIMVRPAAVHDVYLCDRCDGEFATLSEVQTHERECGVTVNVGGQGGTEASALLRPPPSPEPEAPDPPDQDPTDQVARMHQLGLVPAHHTGLPQYCSPAKARSLSGAGGKRGGGASGRGGHKPPPSTHQFSIRKFSRSNYFRFESVDISSPLGRIMLKDCARSNPSIGFNAGGRAAAAGAGMGGAAPSQQLVLRYERHLPATPHVMFPPTRDTSRGLTRWVIVFRNPKLPWYHPFSFTRAQRSERWLTIETGLDCRARTLFHQCQPCSVRLKKVPKRLIDRYARLGDQTRKQQSAVCIDLTGDEAANRAAASIGRVSNCSNEIAAMRAVRKIGVMYPTTAPTVGLASGSEDGSPSIPIAPTPRVGLSPLEHVLNKANGNQKWVIAPGFLEHVIAGGAVPQNGVALALHRLFSPSGLLVKLVNDAMKSRNFSALIVKQYGTVRPSVDQLNRLLYEHGIFDEIGLKLASSPFMVDFAYNYGPVLNNPDLMTRFTTLPPDIPKVTNFLVSSTLANKEFLARPPPLGQRDSASALSSQSAPFYLSPASVPRQKPGPKSKRKHMIPITHTAKASLLVSDSAHKSSSSHYNELSSTDASAPSPSQQIDQKPLLLPPPSFSGSNSIAFNNIVNDPKLKELRRLTPKTLPDDLLCKKLQNMIRESMNPAFSTSQEHAAFAPEHSIFGRAATTPSPPMGGSLITGDPLSSELFKHGAVNDVDEHGIPVIDIIDLSSDEEVEKKISPTKNVFTKVTSVNSDNNNSSSDGSLSNSNRGVVDSEILGSSKIARINRHSGVKSENNSNNHPNLGSSNTNLSHSAAYGNESTNDLIDLSHSSYVSPSNNNSSSSGGRQLHTPESNGTTQTPRRTEKEKQLSKGKVNSSPSSPACSSNTTEMYSKNERSHWPQSPRSYGLGGRKPGAFRVANGGQAVRSDLAGDTSIEDSERGSEPDGRRSSNYATPTAQLGPENHSCVNEKSVVSSLCDEDYNRGAFTLNRFYRNGSAAKSVVYEDEARYDLAASVGVISADDREGGGFSATVGCGTTNRSGHIRIKTSLVPVTIVQPLLKNNNYLTHSPTYEYDSCQAYTAPSYEWDACRIFDDKRRGKKRILSGYDSEYELDEIIRCASPKRVCLDKREVISFDDSDYSNYQPYGLPANGTVTPKKGLALTADFEDIHSSPRHRSYVVDDEISVRLPVLLADEEIIFSIDPGDDIIEDPPPLLMSGGPFYDVTSEDCFEGSEMFEVESVLPPRSPTCLRNLPVVSAETLLEDRTSFNFTESCSGREVPQDDRSESSSNGSSTRSLLSSVFSKGYNFFRNIVSLSSSSEAAVNSSDQQNICTGSSNISDLHSAESRNVIDDQEKSLSRLERASSSDSKDDSSSGSSSKADADGRPPRFSNDVLRCLQDECKELAGLKQLMSVDTGSTGRRVTRRSLQSLLLSPRSCARRTNRSSQFFRHDEITDRRRQTSRKEIPKRKLGSERSETSSRLSARRIPGNRYRSFTSTNGVFTGKENDTVSDSDSEHDCGNQSVVIEKTGRTRVGDGNTGPTSKHVTRIEGASSSDVSRDHAKMLDKIALRLGESLATNLTQGILFDALATSIQLHYPQLLLSQSAAVNNNYTPTNNPVFEMEGTTSTLNTSGHGSSGASASKPAPSSPVRQSARVTSREVCYFDSRKMGPKSPSIMDSIQKRGAKSSDDSSSEAIPGTVAWARPAWITDSACGGNGPESDSTRCDSPIFNFHSREFRNFRTAAPPSKLDTEDLRNNASPAKFGPTSSSVKGREKILQPLSVLTSSDDGSSTDREISVKEFKKISSAVALPLRSNSPRVSSGNKKYRDSSSSSSSSDEARSAPVRLQKRDSVKNRTKHTSDSECDSTPLIRRMNSRKRLRFRASRFDKTTKPRFQTSNSLRGKKIPHRSTFKTGRRRKSAQNSIPRLLERRALARLVSDEWKELRIAGCHPRDIIESCEGSSSSESDKGSKTSLQRQKQPARQEGALLNNDIRGKDATDRGESEATDDLQGTGVEPSKIASSGNLRHTKRIGAGELKALAADEWKEVRRTGFHPKNVLSKMLGENILRKRASLSLTVRTSQAEPSNPVRVQGNVNSGTYSDPPTQISSALSLGGDVVSTSISPSNSRAMGQIARKRMDRPRGWKMLMALVLDECKELRKTGFHPSDVVSNYMTSSREVELKEVVEREREEEGEKCYTDCETDDEDSDDERQSLKRRKKRNSQSAHSRGSDRSVVSVTRNAQHGVAEALISNSPSHVVRSKGFGRRELKNLMEDEWKEFRRTGFHPVDIVNTFKTQDSESSSSEDSGDEEHEGKELFAYERSFRNPKSNAEEDKKAEGYETDTEDVKPPSSRVAKAEKAMSHELRKLFADECKELKGYRNDVRGRGSPRHEGLRRRLVTRVLPVTHSSPKRSDCLSGLVSRPAGSSRYQGEATSSRTQRTASSLDKAGTVPEAMLTVRNYQRDMLQMEGAMCVVNYRLPDIS